MKKAKFLLILLCFCMLLPIVACGKTSDTTDSSTDDTPKYDGLTRETAADSIPDDYDLENQTITFSTPTGHLYSTLPGIVGESDSTDIVYSRVYERNLAVQDRLNFKLEFYHPSGTDWKTCSEHIHREIKAMSSAFEGVFNGGNAVFQMKMFNYYHELTDSNYIDIDDEWWYKDAITELSVDPYGYRFLFGEINIDNISRASCIYYNKDLYEQYVSVNKDKDELYQTVLDGKWTFDEFARLVKKSHISKGGDGSNDIYGFHLNNDEYNHYFRESAGIRLYSRDAYGMPVLSVDVEKAADFATAIYELYFENEGTFNTKYDNRETDATFTNNQFVFRTNKLLLAMDSSMREMKSDFGILPFPKYDEEQEEYISLIHNSSTLVAIPVSTDIDRANEEISAVIEALASESYRSVTVSFYEMALKAAYNRDDQSAQMIDIITGQHDTVKSVITKNFAYEYNSSLSSFGYIYNTLLSKRSNGFASTYDSILPSAKTALTDLIKKYKDGTI